MTGRLALILLASSAGMAGAANIYTSSEGHEYALACNVDGMVLTSVNPVSRFTGTGAATQIEKRIETVYFGRSCDAFLDVAGKGSWGWANGGFGADFPGFELRFPRQELTCETPQAYDGDCRW